MPWALPLLALSPEVLFVGFLLVALALASTVVYKSAGQATGLTGALTAPLRAVVNAWHSLVRATVSRYAVAHLTPLVRFFASMNALVLGASLNYSQAMNTLAYAVERLTHHTIPREAGKAAAPAKAKADAASKTAHTALGKANTASATLTRQHTAQHKLNVHYSTAVDVTIPQQLGRVKTREDKLSSDAQALRERTTSLENGAVKTFEWIRTHPLSAVTGVFAGAVAVALARMGFGFFRCRSWRSLGRRMTCGMATLLDDLLFAAIEGFAVLDICDFANAAQTLAQTFQPTMMQLVDVENALVGCHGATAAPNLPLPALHLPPTNLGLALAG